MRIIPKWLTPKKWRSMPAHLRALHLASSLRHVREVGHNGGFMVEWFLRLVGHKKGAAWCAAFIYWCLVKAGADVAKLPKPWKAAAVRLWQAWASKTGRLREGPIRGDLAFWKNKNGAGHIFFVAEVVGNGLLIGKNWTKIRTIEGNTDGEDGSREGDGVYERWRTRAEMERRYQHGFINLSNL